MIFHVSSKDRADPQEAEVQHPHGLVCPNIRYLDSPEVIKSNGSSCFGASFSLSKFDDFWSIPKFYVASCADESRWIDPRTTDSGHF